MTTDDTRPRGSRPAAEPGDANASEPNRRDTPPDRDAQRAEGLDAVKDEVAADMGIDPDRYGGNVPAKTWGALGGQMVRRLVRRGERASAPDPSDEAKSPPRS